MGEVLRHSLFFAFIFSTEAAKSVSRGSRNLNTSPPTTSLKAERQNISLSMMKMAREKGSEENRTARH